MLGALALAGVLALAGCGTTGSGGGGGGGGDGDTVESLGRIDIIAPAAPGSGWDQTARAVAASLEADGLADTVTVTNVEGASGTVALAQVAPQEGKHDQLIASGLAMMSGVITNGTEVTLDDLTPIARLIGDNEMIVVPQGSPYTDLDSLMEAIKADPASVPIAGGSAGSADHLFIGLLAQAYDIDPAAVNYVPYSGGGEAAVALLGGDVAAGVAGVGEFLEQVKAGELTGIVTSTSTPVEGVEVPTIADAGHAELEFANWRSIMAPPGITEEETEAYIAALTQMVESDAWAEQLETNQWLDQFLAGDEFDAWLDEENARVEGVLTELGLAAN